MAFDSLAALDARPLAPTAVLVALLHLPDETPLAAWRAECERSAQRTREASGALLWVPGGVVDVLITYPDCLGLRAAEYIYVAWRGVLAWRHAARLYAPLTREQIATMPPAQADRMIVGAQYRWVLAAPEETCHVVVPVPTRGGVQWGVVTAGDPQAVPTWHPASFRYVPTPAPRA